MKKTVSILAIVTMAGCAEQTAQTGDYWTHGKDGTVFVHHIKGKIDSVEKLTTNSFKGDLVGDTKAFKVVKADLVFNLPMQKSKPGDSTSKLEAKITNLQHEVEQMAETNAKLATQHVSGATEAKHDNALAEAEPTPEQASADDLKEMKMSQ
jgi:hypothetical protein